MFKPLLPTPVSGHSLAAMFGPRSLTFICTVIVVLSGFLSSASAQDKPADARPSDSVATGQTQSGDSSQTQAAPVANAGPEQRLVHIVPFERGASGVKTTFAPGGAHLTYWGGPVISNVHVVVVFWGTNVDPVVTTPGTIDQFFADITSSRYYDLLTEYSTVDVTGAGTPAASSNQTIGRGQFDSTVTIIPSFCPGPAACTLTDNQIQAELTSQLAAGHLPAPMKDALGIIETFYMIYFPPGVHISLGGAPSCAAGGFCAYHSNTSNLVPYGVLPDFGPTSGCQNPHCGGGTEFQNITAVTSHEMSEAVTDAQVGSATVLGPPLAWYDPSPPPTPDLGEIGDICGGQDVTVSAGAHTYTVQQEFSNVQNDCVSAPPVFSLSTSASGVGPSLPFNATLAIQSSVAAFTLTGYTGTVHFTSSDAQATLPADYTFLAADAGAHQFSFTLKTLGDQTIIVTDTHSAGFTGTATINVNTTPDLTISKSHTGNFSVGQTGAAYTITISNAGHGPTLGTVTVTDALPSGLTATAISGTGWSCTLGTLTCTRGDALAVGSSYPAITLTVNVSNNAPSLVTNTAAVAGGGELNTANDVANDPTTVLAPDLTVLKGHLGPIFGNFFQGETGATYTITVINVGTLASTGTVTVVDTLPAGLTATNISGTGWTCTLATLTCTRSDSLTTFGASYPSITVTVDVALNAPSSVTNVATVSGGGEVNTANDVAQDPTTILPPPAPDLTVGVFHGSNFVQGQTGTYVISVTNVGTKISSGTVVVTDTLPTGLTAASMSGTGWTCSLGTPLTCSRSDSVDFGQGYPQINLTVNIAPDAPATVTNTVSVTGGGDSNTANNAAQDINSVAPPLIDLRPLLGAQLFLSQGQTNVPQSISVANFGNIGSSGPIALTTTFSTGLNATSISGPGWNCTLSNLTCSRPDVIGAGSDSTSVLITYNVANNAPASGSFTTTVSGGGDGAAGNNTVTSTFQITPMVLILPGTDNLSVNPGQSANFAFTVNVLNQAAGTVTFSCSGLPALSSCSFSPPTLTSTALVSMTVTTTAGSMVLGDHGRRFTPNPWLFSALLAFTMFLWSFSGGNMRLKRLRPILCSIGFLLVLALAGCGGGGSQTNVTHSAGTPPGTYAVTVTGTSANGTATHVVNLTVR